MMIEHKLTGLNVSELIPTLYCHPMVRLLYVYCIKNINNGDQHTWTYSVSGRVLGVTGLYVSVCCCCWSVKSQKQEEQTRSRVVGFKVKVRFSLICFDLVTSEVTTVLLRTNGGFMIQIQPRYFTNSILYCFMCCLWLVTSVKWMKTHQIIVTKIKSEKLFLAYN